MINTKLFDSKLTLFAFQLDHTLTGVPASGAANFWDRIAAAADPLGLPRLAELPALISTVGGQQPGRASASTDFVSLLGSPSALQGVCYLDPPARPARAPVREIRLKGEVFPLRFHGDVNAVDLTVRCQAEQITVAELAGLLPGGCLLPEKIHASIGQTLLLYVRPENGDPDQDATLADACAESLLTPPQFARLRRVGQGTLLHSPIFIYDDGTTETRSPPQRCRLMVWLARHPETMALEKTGDYYWPLFGLLGYRGKVDHAYFQATASYHKAEELYQELDATVQRFTEEAKALDLSKLEDLLIELPVRVLKFSNWVRNLANQRVQIMINAGNYAKKLAQLESANEAPLKVLQRTFALEQKQTGGWSDLLNPGQQLFEQLTRSVRGVLEVRGQRQRDVKQQLDAASERNAERRQKALEEFISFGGIALASGAIMATVLQKPVDAIVRVLHPSMNSDLLWYVPLNFLFHFLFGLLVAFALRPLVKKWIERQAVRVESTPPATADVEHREGAPARGSVN